MPTYKELKKLSKTRLNETKVLYDNGLYDGACYLSGYVIELALKARICRVLQLDEYPEKGEISKTYKTHNLNDLVILAGLNKKIDLKKSELTDFFTNWSLVTQWSENFRYKPIGTNARQNTKEIIDALMDPKDGVLTWIMKMW